MGLADRPQGGSYREDGRGGPAGRWKGLTRVLKSWRRLTVKLGPSGRGRRPGEGDTVKSVLTHWLWPPSRRNLPPTPQVVSLGGPPAASRSQPPRGCGGRNGLSTPATSEAARASSWRKRATHVRKDSVCSSEVGFGRLHQTRSPTPIPALR